MIAHLLAVVVATAHPLGPLPGNLLIADRNNNRVLIVTPAKRIVWQDTGLRGPDDAFFTPGGRSIITNEEFNDTLTEVSLATRRPIWRYGHDAVAGSSAGYLNTPEDAYRLANGMTTVADIHNCRVVLLDHSKHVRRILGGSCVHDPPRGFASPNGDTPLPDGGLLVTEIGGWIDRLDERGRLVWSLRSPVSYPSDAQLLPNGRILVSSFTNPGRIVIVTRRGRVTWSFGARSGVNALDKPSLAIRLPNGFIAANDDYNDRVIVIDPRRKRIVWSYGHRHVASSADGYLSKPDGIDLMPATSAIPSARMPAVLRAISRLRVVRIGSLPALTSRLSAVALPGGRIAAFGGLVGGTSSAQVLLGPPERLRAVGRLPVATHDAAAAVRGRSVYLYGGGQAVSTPAVVRVDPATGRVHQVRALDEPLSDLGAAVVGGRTYLVGGYTGSRYATAILRVSGRGRTTVAARLPSGLRYAGVAALAGRIEIAGGLTTRGPSRAVYEFQPANGSVRRIATLPVAVAHAPLVGLGRMLYLVGGVDGHGTTLSRIWRIDTRSGRVVPAGRLPTPLADAAAVRLGGRAIVLGGDAVYAFRP